MLNTSQDVLYLVLAFCILWVTVFFCWLMYHVVSIIRRVEAFMDELGDKMHRIDDAIRGVRDRVEHSVSQLGIIGDAARIVLRHFSHKGDKQDKDHKKHKED